MISESSAIGQLPTPPTQKDMNLFFQPWKFQGRTRGVEPKLGGKKKQNGW